MNKFLTLLKVQFLSLFGINKMLHKGNKKVGAIGLSLGIVAIGALIAVVAYVYAGMFIEAFALTGNLDVFLPTVLSLCAIIALVFSFYTTGSLLYGAKDYELLSSLPIKSHVIVLAKLTFMYVSDLFLGLIIVSASVVRLHVFSGGVVPIDVVRIYIMTIFVPLCPMTVSVVIGAVVSLVSSRFKRKSLVHTILLALIFLGFYALSFIGSDGDILSSVVKFYPLFTWISWGIGSFIYVGLFCAVSLLLAGVVFTFVSLSYKKMNTLIKSSKKNKNFKLGKYSQKGVLKTLVGKEIRTLFSSATYAMNTLTGSVMALVMTIAFVVVAFVGVGGSAFIGMFLTIIIPAYAFCFNIAPTTACSVSIEGSSFWIMKTSPVPARTIFKAKLLVNFFFAVIPATISGIIFACAMKDFAIYSIISVVLIPPLFALFGGSVGLIINLRFPKMKWDNANEVVKSGFSVFLTLLCGMILSGIVVALFVATKLPVDTVLLILLGLMTVLNAIAIAILVSKGEKLLAKVS